MSPAECPSVLNGMRKLAVELELGSAKNLTRTFSANGCMASAIKGDELSGTIRESMEWPELMTLFWTESFS